MFEFLKVDKRRVRYEEIVSAIKYRLIGSFPPANMVVEAIEEYTNNGGNLGDIIQSLRNNCIVFRQHKFGKIEWNDR